MKWERTKAEDLHSTSKGKLKTTARGRKEKIALNRGIMVAVAVNVHNIPVI